MAITHFGNKMLRGTKIDRVVDSLGSSADGTNTGITLLTGAETLKGTPDLTENFGDSSSHSSDGTTVNGWYSSDSDKTFYDGTNNYGRFDFHGQTNSALSFDLQQSGNGGLGTSINSTKWTLRFKFHIITNGSGHTNGSQGYLGIADHDGSATDPPNQDFIGLSLMQNHSLGDRVINGSCNGANPVNFGNTGGRYGTLSLADNTSYYVQITRNGDNCIVEIFSDSGYSSSLFSNTQTISGITGLRYIIFEAQKDSGALTTAYVDDVKFYDNSITKASDTKLGSGAYYWDGSDSTDPEVSMNIGTTCAGATNEYTLAFWLKGDFDYTGSDNRCVLDLSGSNSIQFFKHPTANWKWNFDSGDDLTLTGGATAVPNDDDWHHICITRNSSSLYTIYVDGVSKGSLTQTLNINSGSSQNLHLGAYSDYDGEYWKGSIDDVGLWSRVLTATEISTLCGTTGSLDSDDFDNVYGSTQYARGFKVATSSSALKDKKVKAVTFYVRKNGSPTGTAYAKIYNGTTVVETNTTGTNLDVSTLGTSDYTAHKFEFTGNTTLDTGYSVVYYFDGGSGSAYTQIRRQGSDVYDGVNTIYRKYHSSAWADDSGTDAKFILEFANPQLVSSLTDKSELKAYYSMDSTDLTPTVTHSNSNFGTWGETGSQVTESSNVITADIQTRTANHASTVDLGSNLNTSKWAMRFKLDYNTITRSNTSTFYLDIGIASADHSTALSNSGVGLDFIALQHRASSDTHGWGVVAYYNSGSLDNPEDSTFTTAPSTTGGDGNGVYYVEIIRYMDGSTNKMSIELFSDSSYSTSIEKISKNIHVNSTDALRYVRISNGTVGSGSTGNRITAIVSDIKVYDGIDTFKGCANDFSSTSDLEGLTGVRTNSIFQQTDNTPSYWWYNGTSWVLDGTTLAIDEDFSTNNFTSNDTNVTNVVDGALTYWGAGQNTYGDGAYYKTPVTLDDNKWVMRARYEIEAWASPSGDSYQVFVGMIKFTTAANAQGVSASYNQDGISFGHRIGTGTNGIRIGASNVGGQLYNNFETLTSLTGTRTCWIELTRLSSTTSKLEVFSDEGFTTSIGATPTLTHGAVTGLDTIMINSQQGNGTGGANHGNIDNLQIQNGTSEWLE